MPVDIDPKSQVAVRLGQSLKILCSLPSSVQTCRVAIAGEASMLLSQDDKPVEDDGIEYYGNGTDVGHCGVRIASIKDSNDGNFTCALVPIGARVESIASVRIIVASKFAILHIMFFLPKVYLDD